MRAWISVLAAASLLVGVGAAAAACGGHGGSASAATGGITRCDPGENIFCRCPGGEAGTKTCRDDAMTFEACVTSEGPCPAVLATSASGSGGDASTTSGAAVTSTTGAGGAGETSANGAGGAGGASVTGAGGTSPASTGASGSTSSGSGGAAPGNTCPGIAVALTMGNDVTLLGDTAAASANYKGTDACAAAGTKDVVYAVTPAQTGTLLVTMSPSYDAQLYARSGSCTTGTQLACSDLGGVGATESISFPATAGLKYSVFADGQSGSAGAYSITFHLGP